MLTQGYFNTYGRLGALVCHAARLLSGCSKNFAQKRHKNKIKYKTTNAQNDSFDLHDDTLVTSVARNGEMFQIGRQIQRVGL